MNDELRGNVPRFHISSARTKCAGMPLARYRPAHSRDSTSPPISLNRCRITSALCLAKHVYHRPQSYLGMRGQAMRRRFLPPQWGVGILAASRFSPHSPSRRQACTKSWLLVSHTLRSQTACELASTLPAHLMWPENFSLNTDLCKHVFQVILSPCNAL